MPTRDNVLIEEKHGEADKNGRGKFLKTKKLDQVDITDHSATL